MIPVDESIQGRSCLCLQTASCLLSLPPTPPNLYSHGREALIEDNSPDMRQYICFGLRVGPSLLLEGGLPSAAPRDQDHSTMAVATHLPHRVFETVGLWLVVHGRPSGPVRVLATLLANLSSLRWHVQIHLYLFIIAVLCNCVYFQPQEESNHTAVLQLEMNGGRSFHKWCTRVKSSLCSWMKKWSL